MMLENRSNPFSTAAAREAEVGGLFRQGGLQLEIGFAFGESVLDVGLGGIDSFSRTPGLRKFQEIGITLRAPR